MNGKHGGLYDDTLTVSVNELSIIWSLIEDLDTEYCSWLKDKIMSFEQVINTYVDKYSVENIRNEIERLQTLCGSKDKEVLRDYIIQNFL